MIRWRQRSAAPFVYSPFGTWVWNPSVVGTGVPPPTVRIVILTAQSQILSGIYEAGNTIFAQTRPGCFSETQVLAGTSDESTRLPGMSAEGFVIAGESGEGVSVSG